MRLDDMIQCCVGGGCMRLDDMIQCCVRSRG